MFSPVKRTRTALESAQSIQRRVRRLGFDWPNLEGVLEKIEEELRETRQALRKGKKRLLREEIGDLLFTVIALAQKGGFKAETLLKEANRKFTRRFQKLERELRRRGKRFPQTLKVLDELWNHVKRG